MTDSTQPPTENVAASESTGAHLSEAVLADDADMLSVAPDLLARVLYLRASAASAIAKGNIITVAGISPALCTSCLHTSNTLEGQLGGFGFL